MLPIKKDIELTATIPLEMVNAQQQLIVWCDGKLSILRKEAEDLSDAVDYAKACKWKFGMLEGQHKKTLKRISYYEKVKAALVEGYYIVPNFPIQMFAIRTKKQNVVGWSSSTWADYMQKSQELKIGEGDYKNPFPLVKRRHSEYKDGQQIVKSMSRAEDWDDFEFPITMAKPDIMEATKRAMDSKVFDQIGIMPATRKEDPVIIGQVKMKIGNNVKLVSFMIAWHLNTSVI